MRLSGIRWAHGWHWSQVPRGPRDSGLLAALTGTMRRPTVVDSPHPTAPENTMNQVRSWLATTLVISLAACAPKQADPGAAAAAAEVATEQANKDHVRRFFEQVWSTGNLELRDSFLAVDYRGHSVDNPEPLDRDGWTAWFTGFREAFPDATFTVEDMVAEGDRVAARLTMRGTHQGTLAGIPASGRQVVVSGMSIERIVDGRIVEGWNVNDGLGMFIQLGVIPPPGQ